MSEAFLIAPRPQRPPESAVANRTALAATLGRAQLVLDSCLGGASPVARRFRVLCERFDHERLQIAVLGQFKRGKSTFVNALLGAPLLPAGVVPLTAVATFIAWRAEPLVRVRFHGDRPIEEFAIHGPDEIRDVLFRFVAEEANPANRLAVERVDLLYPADILADGTVIIDTPGIGSTLRHNTEAALQVLPECDVAFFVTSADPPITEVELDYLNRLKSNIAPVFFVLNKADYLSPDERQTALEFLQKVLSEQSLRDADRRVFCVSARDGLAAKQAGDALALERSGIAALEGHVLHELASDKSRWLEDAVRTKAVDVLSAASAELDLRACALNMPVEQLAAKSEIFHDALRAVEEQRRITRDLLVGEHRRLREVLDTRIHELRKEISAGLARVVDANLMGAVPAAWEDATRRALPPAIEEAFTAAREPLASAFASSAGAVLASCQSRVEMLVDRVRQTAAEIFNVPLGLAGERKTFELGEDPYWVTENMPASLIPDPSRLIDRLLPANLRRSRLRARMMRQADELIVRNGENLRWAIVRGLDETFRRTTDLFEERLDEAISATRDVIRDVLARRRDQSFAAQPDLDRLADAASSLASLRSALQTAARHLCPGFNQS